MFGNFKVLREVWAEIGGPESELGSIVRIIENLNF